MQQEEQNIHRQFSDYFANPGAVSAQDLSTLESLIEKYPYCQPLYLLAAKAATADSATYSEKLASAALVVADRGLLYNFIHRPEDFFKTGQNPLPDALEPEAQEAEHTDEVLDLLAQPEEEIDFQEEDSLAAVEESAAPEYREQALESREPEHALEEEGLADEEEGFSTSQFCAQIMEEAPFVENLSELPGSDNLHITPEPDVIDDEHTGEVAATEGESTGLMTSSAASHISLYDDERLPYTFLWWLAKTRKSHENLRPYATFKLDTSQTIVASEQDPLEHQIAENIFHVNGVDGLNDQDAGKHTVAFDFMTREHQIIEKFIKEDPQIKPPLATKIDTENKARSSSEDADDMVTETLARIYTEQMLFEKALDVYKKLSLKYPEKSAYFASQIKYLELKVN